MNREIKFRAWDTEAKQMLVFGLFELDEYYCFRNEKNIEGWPVMQFTGLHDKNYKEIYEGDILKSGNQADEAHPVTIDYYHGLRFMIGKNYLVRADALYGEVIGNIYENPELLTDSIR
jgi:hypothetical protein